MLSELHHLLKFLPSREREKYADLYAQILDYQQIQWRPKLILTRNFEEILGLFETQTTLMIIIPVLFSLCKDSCAWV